MSDANLPSRVTALENSGGGCKYEIKSASFSGTSSSTITFSFAISIFAFIGNATSNAFNANNMDNNHTIFIPTSCIKLTTEGETWIATNSTGSVYYFKVNKSSDNKNFYAHNYEDSRPFFSKVNPSYFLGIS